jgi:hypothetical protein
MYIQRDHNTTYPFYLKPTKRRKSALNLSQAFEISTVEYTHTCIERERERERDRQININ